MLSRVVDLAFGSVPADRGLLMLLDDATGALVACGAKPAGFHAARGDDQPLRIE